MADYPRLGTERFNALREKVEAKRALNEGKEVAPFTDEDMTFEPLDADMLKRTHHLNTSCETG